MIQVLHSFQALSSANMSGITYDTNRVRTLLELTFDDRRKLIIDPLPHYFLNEKIVSERLLLLGEEMNV